MQKPSLGRIVFYKLTEHDARWIDQHVPSAGRNPVSKGQAYPAQVTAVFDPSSTTANLVVQLDGVGQYWVTSRVEGDEPGQWSWPPRV